MIVGEIIFFRRVILQVIQLDWRIVEVSFLAALLSCLVFGLAPAWQAVRLNFVGALKDGGHGTSSGRRTPGRGLRRTRAERTAAQGDHLSRHKLREQPLRPDHDQRNEQHLPAFADACSERNSDKGRTGERGQHADKNAEPPDQCSNAVCGRFEPPDAPREQTRA